MNKKKESQPTDMHSDDVHFDKDILESKRGESARENKHDEATEATLTANVKDGKEANEKALKHKDKKLKDKADSKDDTKKSKKQIRKEMEGGYNRDAPINDDDT